MKQVSLYVFNPWHDMALANYRANYQPPASAVKMAEDLALLPSWIAQEGDVVCDFRSRIPDVEKYQVKPWGWDLLVCRMLHQWNPSVQLPSREYLDGIRKLSSRALAVSTLKELCESSSDVYVGESFLCTSLQQIEELLKRYPDVIMKQLWSSSGKGLKLIRGDFEAPLQNWCRRAIQMQGGVVLEPRYERILDFAMEFISDGEGHVSFQSYSVFSTSEQGMYAGNQLGTDEYLEEEILRRYGREDSVVLKNLKEQISLALSQNIGTNYVGPLGVDMMLVKEASGEVKIHPCVEINLRFNMGQFASALSRKILAEGHKGMFKIDFSSQPGAMLTIHEQMLKNYPLVKNGEQVMSGYLALNPISETTCYRAFILVE